MRYVTNARHLSLPPEVLKAQTKPKQLMALFGMVSDLAQQPHVDQKHCLRVLRRAMKRDAAKDIDGAIRILEAVLRQNQSEE